MAKHEVALLDDYARLGLLDAKTQGADSTAVPSSEDPPPTATSLAPSIDQDEELQPPELVQVVEFPHPLYPSKTQTLALDRYETKINVEEDEFKTATIIVRRLDNARGKTLSVQVEIQSKSLQSAMRKATKGVDYDDLNFTPDLITIARPYHSLFFLREPLRERASSPGTKPRLRDEINLLLGFIESRECLGNSIAKFEKLVPNNKISFDILWMLFPPFELVYVKLQEFDECFLVQKCSPAASLMEGRTLLFSLIYSCHDGKQYGLKTSPLSVPRFSGTTEISTHFLSLVPLRFLEKSQQERIRERFTARAKTYLELQKADFTMKQHFGWIWVLSGTFLELALEVDNKKKRIEVRFNSPPSFIAGIKLIGCNSRTDVLSIAGADDEDEGNIEELADVEYVICQSSLVCFMLDRKAWVKVLVEELRDIDWYPDPWATLQMESETKSLVKTLVQGFSPTEDVFAGWDDIVEGKGKGLIFLLHGLPGLGKTFTAETIAEQTRRPLYQVSTGELSIDVRQLEAQLRQIFRLGWRWGAIVLIDEADVIMAERDLSDLARSAIVAVFLRLVEYYRGLLFLTTNKIENFDPAFYNRIHAIIEYTPLGKEARINIWRNLLHNRKRGSINLDASWDDQRDTIYSLLGDLDMNGRDIRNLIRAAYGVAQAKKVPLGVRHITRVLTRFGRAANREEIANRLEFAARKTDTFTEEATPDQQATEGLRLKAVEHVAENSDDSD
ncbi:P-loop containing nucleoside triphosphate hydrolase protein [Thozetella sp. PMI_491]|nr:P-loop containing nucleoside triphosphate hydrolase protein [Thozetella sp. PMI_491]